VGQAQRRGNAENFHPRLREPREALRHRDAGGGQGQDRPRQRFKGKVNLTDIDAPNSYRISGQGDGGIAGFAKGGANVRLADADGGGTRLGYDVDAQIGGKIAQLGSRLIDSTAKKLAEQFFANFATALGGAS